MTTAHPVQEHLLEELAQQMALRGWIVCLQFHAPAPGPQEHLVVRRAASAPGYLLAFVGRHSIQVWGGTGAALTAAFRPPPAVGVPERDVLEGRGVHVRVELAGEYLQHIAVSGSRSSLRHPSRARAADASGRPPASAL